MWSDLRAVGVFFWWCKNRRKFAFLQQIWKSPACSRARCFYISHSPIGKSPSASASLPTRLLPLLALAILTHTRTRNIHKGGPSRAAVKKNRRKLKRENECVRVWGGFGSPLPDCLPALFFLIKSRKRPIRARFRVCLGNHFLP